MDSCYPCGLNLRSKTFYRAVSDDEDDEADWKFTVDGSDVYGGELKDEEHPERRDRVLKAMVEAESKQAKLICASQPILLLCPEIQKILKNQENPTEPLFCGGENKKKQKQSSTQPSKSGKSVEEVDDDDVLSRDFLETTTLIFGFGEAACAFLQSFIIQSSSSRVIGSVFTGSHHSTSKNSIGQSALLDSGCFIHQLSHTPEVLIVLCKSPISAEQSYAWTQQIFSLVDVKNTYVAVLGASAHHLPSLGSTSTSNANDDTNKCRSLRALKTSRFLATPPCAYLEAPTLIGNCIEAEILTFCQLNRMPAILYVLFDQRMIGHTIGSSAPHRIDKKNLHHAVLQFTPILKSTPIKDTCVDLPSNAEHYLRQKLDNCGGLVESVDFETLYT